MNHRTPPPQPGSQPPQPNFRQHIQPEILHTLPDYRRRVGKQLCVLTLLGLTVIVSLGSRAFLPTRFLLDDGHIQRAIADPTGATDAESFRLIAAIYRSLGLADTPSLAAVLAVGIFVIAVYAAIPLEAQVRLGAVGFVLLATSCLFAVVYLGQYTKELITVIVAALVLLLPRAKFSDFIIVTACLVYGLSLRPYWLLIAVLYLLMRWLLARQVNVPTMIAWVFISYAALAVAFSAVLGQGLESQRTWLNQERAQTVVNSLISGPFPTATGAISVLSIVLVLLSLLFPVPLFFDGDPQLMIAAVLISAIWLLVIWAAFSHDPRAFTQRSTQPRVQRALALLFALVMVQALFEPDYGSYLKHLTGVLPLALSVVPLRPAGATSQRLLTATSTHARQVSP